LNETNGHASAIQKPEFRPSWVISFNRRSSIKLSYDKPTHHMTTMEYNFRGWIGLDAQSADGNLVEREYEVKTFEENDVDIKITHCGICGELPSRPPLCIDIISDGNSGSDIHTLRSGWGRARYPCVVGHEIVGTAVRVGQRFTHVKVLAHRAALA
jgi:hypothetical protein